MLASTMQPIGRETDERQVRIVVAGSSGCLVCVAGVPLVVRTVVTARRAGFAHVVVLVADPATVGDVLAAHPSTRGVVEVSERIVGLGRDPLIVVAGDMLVSAETLLSAARTAQESPVVVLASPHGAPAIACGRAADVLGGLADRGLRLEDCPTLFREIRDRESGVRSADGLIRRIADAGDVADAEAALCAGMRAESAPSDGFLARLDRRISCGISRWIVRHTRLRPNHITAIGTAIGLGAAVELGRGTYASGVIGTLLFVVAAIVDGCDGEVARLTFRESPFGQRLDVATDNLVHLAIFIGLAVGLRRSDPDGHHGVLAAVLLAGFALDAALSYYFLVVRKEWRSSAGRGPRQRVLKALEALMNRDFAYLLLVLAVAGRLHWFLWGAAIGSFVFAAVFVAVYAIGDAP